MDELLEAIFENSYDENSLYIDAETAREYFNYNILSSFINDEN